MSAVNSSPIFKLHVQGVAPQLHRNEQGRFTLSLNLNGLQETIELNAAQVRALGLSCLHYFPDLEPRYVVPAEEDAFRRPARRISRIDDHSLRLLLREVVADDLINFLWYMNDVDFAQRVFAMISEREAEKLFDDMRYRFGRAAPDQAPLALLEKGRASTLRIIDVFEQWEASGMVVFR